MIARELSVAVVMPAYNESALATFVSEIDEALRPSVNVLNYVIVDDCSPIPAAEQLLMLPDHLLRRISVERSPRNMGHGPSALHAYRAGLALQPDVVIHVDGDGQFEGRQVASVGLVAARRGAAVGVRHSRSDPWFRRLLSCAARAVVGRADGNCDVNSPLRAYRAEHLRRLMERVPPNALVPHLHFARHHAALGLLPVTVPVQSLPRRGATETGTMWGPPRRFARIMPSWRLLAFAVRALLELQQSSLLRGERSAHFRIGRTAAAPARPIR